MNPQAISRGRFAPSPTGPLHLGSLVAALGSYLNVRQRGGEWLIRIDDIDSPRNVPQMDQTILSTLEQHSLQWDGTVYYSSQHLADYEQAFTQLETAGLIFPCSCSRREIQLNLVNAKRNAGNTLVYPGTCENAMQTDKPLRSYRLKVLSTAVRYLDVLQGNQADCLAESVGGFVVKDSQGQHHYQLATVVDDQLQQITEVVRGADLLASTGRQIHLQNTLGYNHPTYYHLPVVTDRHGDKLSKQLGARGIDNAQASLNLITALELLQQQPPAELCGARPPEILQWASEHWSVEPLKMRKSITYQND